MKIDNKRVSTKDSLKKNGDLTAVFIMIVVLSFIMMTLQYLMVGFDVDLTISQNSEVIYDSAKYQFPIDILAMCLIAYIVIISGANVGRSFLKIGLLPEGSDSSLSEVPLWKIKQVFVFLWLIATLAVYATVLQVTLGSDIVDFGVDAWYNAVVAAALSYASLRSVPKVAEGIYIPVPESMRDVGYEKDLKPKDKKEIREL